MKLVVLLAAVLVATMAAAGAAVAQPIAGSGWSWQLPSWPMHEDVDFVSPTVAWAQGPSRLLLHTADGGMTWDTRTMPCDPWAIDFVDAQHGWAIGSVATSDADAAGAVWRTSDGGASWSRWTFPAWPSLTGVSFADTQHGCLLSQDGAAFWTSSGGDTWSAAFLVGAGGLRGITMADATHAWAWGAAGTSDSQGAIYSSTDGGATWGLQATTTEVVTGVVMATPQAGWCATYSGVLHTTDGGATWTTATPAVDPSSWTILTTTGDGSHAWVAGATFGSSAIYATADGGASWRRQAVDPADPAYSAQLHAFSDDDLIAFGGVADTWTSDDGGDSWTRVVDGGSQQWTQSLSFVSATEGWAATPYSTEGEIRHTVDGGQTWDGVELPTEPGTGATFDPSVVRFLDSEHGWAVGWGFTGRAVLAATTDGGATWALQTVPRPAGYTNEIELTAVDFSDALRGWAVGSDGAIIRTTDGGHAWKRQRGLDGSYSASWSAVDAVSASRCCVVGSSGGRGTIARTTDGGATWRLVKPAGLTGRPLLSICFTDALRGWATGAQGVLLHTSDGGATWQNQGRRIMSFSASAITFTDARHGWILADGSLLWRTTDGGSTWRVRDPLCPDASCIVAAGTDTVYVGGLQGIVKTTTGGASPGGFSPPGTKVRKPAGLWHNHPVDLGFTIGSAGGGYLTTLCDVGGVGTFWAPGKLWLDPGRSHLEGIHAIEVLSLDSAGVGGGSTTFKLGLDTRLPNTYALKNATVAKGSTVRLPYRIKDPKPGCGRARVWLNVFTKKGAVLRSVAWGVRKTNVSLTGSFRCTLPAGNYGWLVAARDIAGNTTNTAYYSLLRVTSGRGSVPAGRAAEPALLAGAGWTAPALAAVRDVQTVDGAAE